MDHALAGTTRLVTTASRRLTPRRPLSLVLGRVPRVGMRVGVTAFQQDRNEHQPMKKFLLATGKVIAGFFGMVVLWLAGDWGWEQYKFYSWEPPTVIDGIYLGMTKSDVLFTKGVPTKCEQTSPSEETCEWRKEFESSSLTLFFTAGLVHRIVKFGSWYELGAPFSTVEDMRKTLGGEDIMATADGGILRLYTYGGKKISFGFHQNGLEYLSLGEVEWRSLGGKGEYFIRGKRICPGDNCPFDSETGDVKPEYRGMSYVDFLPSP